MIKLIFSLGWLSFCNRSFCCGKCVWIHELWSFFENMDSGQNLFSMGGVNRYRKVSIVVENVFKFINDAVSIKIWKYDTIYFQGGGLNIFVKVLFLVENVFKFMNYGLFSQKYKNMIKLNFIGGLTHVSCKSSFCCGKYVQIHELCSLFENMDSGQNSFSGGWTRLFCKSTFWCRKRVQFHRWC